MREIKFRGKNNGKWIYGFLRRASNGDCFISYEHDHKWYELQVDHKTVGEYTGLKDKNGKEIYENDIIIFSNYEFKKEIGKIIFDTENCCFCIAMTQELFAKQFNHEYEIIGNIHEEK